MRLAVFFAALLMLTSPALADELGVRTAIETNVWNLLNGGKFGELNKLAEQYRTSHEKTPSGHPKLDLFYIGLMHPPGGARLTELQWGNMFLQADMWIEKQPSPAAHIALADLYIANAWRERGNGYANSVKPEQWKAFQSLLKLARRELEASKKTADIDPEWYSAMLEVARGEQWPAADSVILYAEATRKYKDYFPIYHEIVISLQPKWGGSWVAVEKFAEYAAANSKEGDALYARLFWEPIECGCAEAVDQLGNWGRIKKGFGIVLSRYPVPWNLNNFGYIACLEGDRKTERSLLQRISNPMIAGWDGKRKNYDTCRAWALGPDL